MGIFDDLRGLIGGAPMAPDAPAAPRTLNDRLMNPLTQAGLQLLANNGTRKSDRAAFLGVGEALTGAAQYQTAKQEKNKTLAYLRERYPEIASQVDAGLDVGSAFKMAIDQQQFDREMQFRQSQANRGPGPTEAMRNFEYAKQNPEFAQMYGGSEAPTSIREITERQRLAPNYGLDPASPEGRAFVLTGKLPSAERTSTADDRRAIRDADDAALGAESTLGLIDRATELSKTAYDGAGAPARAWAGSLVGEQAALDTIELDNIVKEQALGQLKTIFGGAPTEGERQILLEIQGASNQPQSVRESIFRRARGLVEKRLQYNRDRAMELRGGTYYDPRTAPATSPAPSAGGNVREKYGLE